MYSDTLSKYYDALMGDYSSIVDTTQTLVKRYSQEQSHILELGCGTGNMLRVLQKHYRLSGLDNSQGMLAIARKKVPNVSLYRADMRTFTLNQKFDTILCIFDTINHLPVFSDWQKCFLRVHKHLRPNGVFIFDMNTVRRLDSLSMMQTFVSKPDKDTLACVKIHKTGKQQYAVKFQILQDIQKEKPLYTEEIVHESAYELQEIKKALKKNFTVEKTVDPIRRRITTKTGRIFFVCKKR